MHVAARVNWSSCASRALEDRKQRTTPGQCDLSATSVWLPRPRFEIRGSDARFGRLWRLIDGDVLERLRTALDHRCAKHELRRIEPGPGQRGREVRDRTAARLGEISVDVQRE
jgi:hypothetical protein